MLRKMIHRFGHTPAIQTQAVKAPYGRREMKNRESFGASPSRFVVAALRFGIIFMEAVVFKRVGEHGANSFNRR
jgi:hypothetical protein